MQVNFRAKFNEEDILHAAFDEEESLSAKFGEIQKVSTTDYNDLYNKPKIEGVTLQGDKSFPELGLRTVTEQEIDIIVFGG